MSEAALEGLDMWDAYEKSETGLQKVFYTLGMRVSDLRASSYATTRFSAMPRTYYKECACLLYTSSLPGTVLPSLRAGSLLGYQPPRCV